MNKKDRLSCIDYIEKVFWGKKIELDYETPFQLLCAVILSAQTTDKQVNRITPPLFAKIRDSRDVLDLSLDDIETHTRYVNFYKNKSRFIKETGEILTIQHNGVIPNDLKLIQTFPGIGIKTAKVVLSVLYDMPYVWVDTHIHRVMNRLGIVKTKTPEQTDKEIDRIFSEKEKQHMHHPMVLFGRYHCTARKPKCESCELKSRCQYYKDQLKKNKIPKKLKNLQSAQSV